MGYQVLPSLSAKGQLSLQKAVKSLMHPSMVMLVHPDVASTEIVLDPEYETKHRQWREENWRLTGEVSTEEWRRDNVNYSDQERAASNRKLKLLEEQIEERVSHEPKRATAADADDSLDKSAPGNQTRANNLNSAGYHELRYQHQLKLMNGASAVRRHMANRVEQLGGGLSLLIAGLNIYNFIDAARTAQKEGVDDEDMRKLAATTGAATVAVMSLWVMPFWNRAAKRSFRFNGNMMRLTDVSIGEWQSNGRHSASRIAAKLATRMAGLSAIGAIAAGLDAKQSYHDLSKATSGQEYLALAAKTLAGGAMTTTAVIQLGGAALGRWFAFAWILGPKVAVVLFVAGIVHLIASHFAARYKREGVREWLYKSTWGKGDLEWEDNDEGNKNEWRALMEILLQPSVKLTGVTDVTFDSSNMSNHGVGDITRSYQGCWVQVAFPALLAGETVKISENVREGFWAPGGSFEQSPSRQSAQRQVLPADAEYSPDEVRVWQAWIPASKQAKNASFILTVDYSETLLSSNEGQSNYTFYKADAASGKKEIEPDSEESRGVSAPTRFELTVPITPEE